MAAVRHISATYPVSAEDQGRAGFYAVLGALLGKEPSEDFLRRLGQADELVAEDSRAELPTAWNALCAAAAVMPLDAAREEFQALFQGVGRPAVLPYGSYYLTGFMMEEPLADLRSDLAGLGLARRGDATESEDHIAALADIMRHLIMDGSRPDDDRAEAQQQFFDRHMAPWYERFCDSLEKAEQANFYRHVARFARAFLHLETESFKIDA